MCSALRRRRRSPRTLAPLNPLEHVKVTALVREPGTVLSPPLVLRRSCRVSSSLFSAGLHAAPVRCMGSYIRDKSSVRQSEKKSGDAAPEAARPSTSRLGQHVEPAGPTPATPAATQSVHTAEEDESLLPQRGPDGAWPLEALLSDVLALELGKGRANPYFAPTVQALSEKDVWTVYDWTDLPRKRRLKLFTPAVINVVNKCVAAPGTHVPLEGEGPERASSGTWILLLFVAISALSSLGSDKEKKKPKAGNHRTTPPSSSA